MTTLHSPSRQKPASRLLRRRLVWMMLVGCCCLVLTVIVVYEASILRGHPSITTSSWSKTALLEAFMDMPRTDDRMTTTTKQQVPKAIVAYAWTLTKCGDFQSSAEGMIDAALVLRHSIHLNSIENPSSSSRYGYKMYVFVHPQAKQCSRILQEAGYTVLIRDPPVNVSDIKGNFLRTHVHREWCCGADEFIKLYSYTLLEHEIVVHLDIDFAFYQPMDELFDAMLLPPGNERRHEAEQEIITEYPNVTFPDNIEAYVTRDYHQVPPGTTPLFQAGFLVVKPNMERYEELKSIILEGKYSEELGWGRKGYGRFVGAMAMQGLMAYYYDVIRPGTSVELRGCRYNFMGADILYRNVPNWRPNSPHKGKCRNGMGTSCEDCLKVDVSLIKSVHYTNCRKPWNCIGVLWSKEGRRKPKEQGIDLRTSDYDLCMNVTKKWHEVRTDLEDKVIALSKKSDLHSMRNGTYKKDVFMGHCHGNGQHNYIPLGGPPESYSQIYEKTN